jgi:hypothetical protein
LGYCIPTFSPQALSDERGGANFTEEQPKILPLTQSALPYIAWKIRFCSEEPGNITHLKLRAFKATQNRTKETLIDISAARNWLQRSEVNVYSPFILIPQTIHNTNGFTTQGAQQ